MTAANPPRAGFTAPSAIIRWLVLLFVCVGISGFVWIVLGHQLDLWGWHVCPPGFWHESPGHCAFPPVSILQLGLAYGVIALLLLAVVAWLAPVRKFTACLLLLAGLALWPVYVLLFKKLSWVALVCLTIVIGITVCFLLGAFAARGVAAGRHTHP